MCGLYGAITKLNENENLTPTQREQKQRIVEGLMVANMARGTDSTGIATIKNNKMAIVKNAVNALEFVQCQECKVKLEANPQILLGHTRWATTGEVNQRNAHPFKYGRIVGAHNGQVSNHLEVDNKVRVDSEVIFKLLNNSKNDFRKVFKRLSGQFAITWLDLENPNSVYLVRDDNPLALAVVPSLKTMFWSSEDSYLQAVLMAVLGEPKAFKIFNLKKDHVYLINSTLQITKTPCEFKPSVKYDYYGRDGYYSGYDYATPNKVDYTTYDFDDWQDNAIQQAEEFGCDSCHELPAQGFYFDKEQYILACPNCYKKKEFNDCVFDWVDTIIDKATIAN